ncbi:MAG: FkbM family methyltransferase, partial [Limisphaerales bacterium]
PKARFLCIEAQPAHEAELKSFVAQHPQVEYALCAAGERVGKTSFDATDLLGGWVQSAPKGPKSIDVPMSTIDILVTKRGLPPPYLIKLDTHGYELPILAGAAATLKRTEALVVEVYNLPGGPPAVPFYEFCRWMAGQGFRCIDMFDPLYRPLDQAFWQMDLVFLRSDRPEFQQLAYA